MVSRVAAGNPGCPIPIPAEEAEEIGFPASPQLPEGEIARGHVARRVLRTSTRLLPGQTTTATDANQEFRNETADTLAGAGPSGRF